MADKYNGMRRARDWLGKRIRLMRDISTGAAVYPKGMAGTVMDTGPSMYVKGEPCPCCGVSMYIRKLSYFDIVLHEQQPPSE